jgi:hypothetical protein
MKRLITLFILVILSLGAFAQTRAKTGLTVGNHNKVGTNIFILDSITKATATIRYRIYNGATLQYPYGVILVSDTAGMLTNYILDIEVQSDINDSLDARFGGALDADQLYPELADTIPLFTAGYGWGAAIDTTGIDITADFGGWYNDGSDSIPLAKVIGIVKASKNTPTVTINVYWDVNYYDATPDSAFTSGLVVTSTTAGTAGTTFAKAKIPPHVWVWVKPCRSLGTTGTKPSKLRVSVSGYKIPKY